MTGSRGRPNRTKNRQWSSSTTVWIMLFQERSRTVDKRYPYRQRLSPRSGTHPTLVASPRDRPRPSTGVTGDGKKSSDPPVLEKTVSTVDTIHQTTLLSRLREFNFQPATKTRKKGNTKEEKEVSLLLKFILTFSVLRHRRSSQPWAADIYTSDAEAKRGETVVV